MNAHLNREKYLKIVHTAGLDAALTELHDDLSALEDACFEGAKGWQPEIWEDLKTWRNFSKELWDLKLKN